MYFDINDVGQELRTARLSLGLTQEQVSRRARVSRTTLLKLERQVVVDIQVNVLLRILRVLGLDLRTCALDTSRPDFEELQRQNRLEAKKL
jgi:transcriptional regulator with XRE-family HTH domain